jgi:hypothetical protein
MRSCILLLVAQEPTIEEQFHDAMCDVAESGLTLIQRWWREHGVVPPFLALWSEEEFRRAVDPDFTIELPEDPEVQKKLIWKAAKTVNAHAALVVRQLENEVRAVFETREGTKSWHYPIRDHGPDRVLGDPTVRVDEHHIGVLRSPSSQPEAEREEQPAP